MGSGEGDFPLEEELSNFFIVGVGVVLLVGRSKGFEEAEGVLLSGVVVGVLFSLGVSNGFEEFVVGDLMLGVSKGLEEVGTVTVKLGLVVGESKGFEEFVEFALVGWTSNGFEELDVFAGGSNGFEVVELGTSKGLYDIPLANKHES